jgi:hypothetical protein
LTIRAYYRLRRAYETRRPENVEPAAEAVSTPPAFALREEIRPANEWRH